MKERIIRILPIIGKLYSTVHNLSVSANDAIRSLKENDLNIDGVSRRSRFRRKKDEFIADKQKKPKSRAETIKHTP